ncbi:MAG: hypothetical protein WC365_08210 [Candidatus Babeliales bacterium]|jgi:hypothetical protein
MDDDLNDLTEGFYLGDVETAKLTALCKICQELRNLQALIKEKAKNQ